MTRAEVDRRAGLRARGTEDLERGKGEPKVGVLAAVAVVFGVTLDEMVSGSEGPTLDQGLDGMVQRHGLLAVIGGIHDRVLAVIRKES